MVKVYCLVINGGDYQDMELTLSLEKALDWMKEKPKTRHILEYNVTEEEILDTWYDIWYIDNDGNVKHGTD
jgi:hypothetical protein